MRRLIRLALYLFIILVVLVVAGVLLRNTIAKEMVESRLRARTGMDVRIGQIEIGLLSPTLTFENVKLYNTADFGGGIFIDMPELHLEYDPQAMRAGALHFKLVRLDLAEFALVQDKKGRSNMKEMEKAGRAAPHRKKSSGDDLKFTGIDTLNLTLGKFRIVNLGSGHEDEINCGIKNEISHNVTSATNLPALSLLQASHSGPAGQSATPGFDLSVLLNNLIAR
jgi:uncharacterized protein involved in outer membrane biogenesis